MGEEIRKHKTEEDANKGPTIVDIGQLPPKKKEQKIESQTSQNIEEQTNQIIKDKTIQKTEDQAAHESDAETKSNTNKDSDTSPLVEYEIKDNKLPSHYGEYEEPCIRAPQFRQILNGCGFSSLLMLIDPLKNQDLALLLDTLWNSIQTILKDKVAPLKELQWSYVLEYLLFKSYTNKILVGYLNGEFQDDFESFMALFNGELSNFQMIHQHNNRRIYDEAYNQYFNESIINPLVINQHIRQFKLQYELKPLFAIFGYEFIHNYLPLGSVDGLGAIFFDQTDLKNPGRKEVEERLEYLKIEFEKGARILYGLKEHWKPVINIAKNKMGYLFTFNDSLYNKKQIIPFSKLPDSNWFYVFRKKKDQSRSKKILKNLPELIQSEINKDLKAEREFLKRFDTYTAEEGQKTGGKKKIIISTEVTPEEPTQNIESQKINDVKITSEILDLSSSEAIQEKNLEPMSGDAFKDYIKQIIRSKFSDYEKL